MKNVAKHSCARMEILKTSKIEDADYSLLVITGPRVKMLAARMLNGEMTGPVHIAELDGKYYPIDGLDVLEAAKKTRIRSVPCVVYEVDSIAKVVQLHINSVNESSWHPISTLDMADKIKKMGIDGKSLPPTLQNLDGMKISDEARKRINTFVKEVSKTYYRFPSMTHLLRPISDVQREKQDKAVKTLVKYITLSDNPSIPGTNMTKRIFAEYSDDDQNLVVMPEIEDWSDDEPTDEVTVTATQTRKDLAENVDTLPTTMKLKCVCKENWLIDLKGANAKRIVEKRSHIDVVESQDGENIFLLNSKDVQFLSLDLSPNIYKKYIGGSKSGHSIIITKRHLTSKQMLEISRVFDKHG